MGRVLADFARRDTFALTQGGNNFLRDGGSGPSQCAKADARRPRAGNHITGATAPRGQRPPPVAPQGAPEGAMQRAKAAESPPGA
jgi:hypothetical protein